MPYRDEAGAEHVSAIDPVTYWSQLHIESCEPCRANLFTKLIRNENNMGSYEGESVMRASDDRRFVEDDLLQLADIDNSIRELLARREQKVNEIKKSNASNQERLNLSEDWYEGSLKGNPVSPRGESMTAEEGFGKPRFGF